MVVNLGRANSHRLLCLTGLITLAIGLSSCSGAYFSALERFGYPKRDLLVSRVAAAKESQNEAKEQFRDALTQFQAIVQVPGGELQQKYDVLSSAFDRSKERAAAVRDRIDKVQSVAEALFDEWENELESYSSDKLRRRSSQRLKSTRGHYQQMLSAMRKAESSMEPVLRAFNDQVLFLKHNLNARAVASLRGELESVETEIATLVREMERSIYEADTFVRALKSQTSG